MLELWFEKRLEQPLQQLEFECFKYERPLMAIHCRTSYYLSLKIVSELRCIAQCTAMHGTGALKNVNNVHMGTIALLAD